MRDKRSRWSQTIAGAIGILAAFSCHQTLARDLPRFDPLRAELLDQIRQPETKLLVKDLLTDGATAYACVVNIPARLDGKSSLRADKLEYREWLLLRVAGGRWLAMEWEVLPLTESAECPTAWAITSVQNVIDLLVEGVSFNMPARASQLEVSSLLYAFEKPVEQVFTELARRGYVPSDFSVETEKQFDRQLREGELCQPDSDCQEVLGAQFEDLEILRKAPAISSMVWEGCMTIARAAPRLQTVSHCMNTAASKPSCKPGLMYYRDRAAIEKCKYEVYQACAAAVSDKSIRQKSCDLYFSRSSGRTRSAEGPN